MQVVIRIARKDTAKAWSVLVSHSPGIALPERTFIVSSQAANALRRQGVGFREIARNGIPAPQRGARNGKRV